MVQVFNGNSSFAGGLLFINEAARKLVDFPLFAHALESKFISPKVSRTILDYTNKFNKN